MRWRESDGVRWLEANLQGATAAFTTRVGGVSEPPFDRLNLGALTDDSVEAVVENRVRLASALDLTPECIAFAHQVHGAELATHPRPPFRCSFASHGVAYAQRSNAGAALPAVDGHVLAEPGGAALVFVADCVPVALAGPRGVAMLHCGWRGMAAGIVAKGAAATGATEAAVGPCIGSCCYEVGDEVLEGFSGLGEGIAAGRMLDLPEIARRLLFAAGVERVELSGLCTSCESQLFFSHRRDAGRTGRQAGLIWREAEGV